MYRQMYLPFCAQRLSRPLPSTDKTRAYFRKFVELVQSEYQQGTITFDQREGLIQLATCSFLEATVVKNVGGKFCEVGDMLAQVEEQIERHFSE